VIAGLGWESGPGDQLLITMRDDMMKAVTEKKGEEHAERVLEKVRFV
jgi:hypothetical protein